MGAFTGATRSGAALCAVQVFSPENLDAGRIQFARADEGAGALAGLDSLGRAGTQAEDTLTMKQPYQASQSEGMGAFTGATRAAALCVRQVFSLKGKTLMPGEFSSPVQMKGPGPPAGLGPLGQAQAPRRRTR